MRQWPLLNYYSSILFERPRKPTKEDWHSTCNEITRRFCLTIVAVDSNEYHTTCVCVCVCVYL